MSPLANLVDPGMLSSESPTHADDASLLVRSRASDDAMADHEHPGLDRARDQGGSHEESNSVGSSASGDARRDFPNEKRLKVQYEKSPLTVWMGMLVNLLASALATAGLGVSAALYPIYAVTPTPVLAFLGKNAFNLGYLIYMSPIGRWLHLRAVKSHHETNQPPHSRGVRPSPLSTCSILPVPFLTDNYAYVLVDHATRECAAIDPADPYGVKDLCDRLELTLVAILTTHKHHDHAGGNHELQRACGGTLAVYGHALDDCAGVTRRVVPGDVVRVGETKLGVVHVPCHTTGHVVYAVLGMDEEGRGVDARRAETTDGNELGGDDGGGGAAAFDARKIEALFTGDAIINGGVGAFFHGGPRDCYDNLHVRLRSVPDAALVFSGHEYMQMNLKYAHWLDEACEATASAAKQVAARRHRGLSTQPSSLAVERRVNPYFRVRERAYVDKIARLEKRIERGKRKRWYLRYLPERRGARRGGDESGKDRDEEKGADDTIVGAEDVELGGLGGGAAPPSVAESLRCIETLQSLTQYRHLIEDAPVEAPRASRRSSAEGGGGRGADEHRAPPSARAGARGAVTRGV